eukprot:5615797-Prymnesium_polylepis.1
MARAPVAELRRLLASECQPSGSGRGPWPAHKDGRPQDPRALEHSCDDSGQIVEALSSAYADDLQLLPGLRWELAVASIRDTEPGGNPNRTPARKTWSSEAG